MRSGFCLTEQHAWFYFLCNYFIIVRVEIFSHLRIQLLNDSQCIVMQLNIGFLCMLNFSPPIQISVPKQLLQKKLMVVLYIFLLATSLL